MTTVSGAADVNDDDASSSINSSTNVQLGFCVPVEDASHYDELAHRSTQWGNWDGGQVGGRPSWLHPPVSSSSEDPGGLAPLTCRPCGGCTNTTSTTQPQMNFVCQLYAPRDGAAFHRTLYVFGCPICSHMRAIRMQLPRDNPVWPSTSNHSDEDSDMKRRMAVSKMCAVCGFPAKGTCAKQKVSFCGTAHQKLHHKHTIGNSATTSSTTTTTTKTPWISTLPNVYTALELVVEEEPPIGSEDRPTTTTTPPMFETLDDDESDDDEQLEQDDLNAIVGKAKATTTNNNNNNDRVYQAFLDRLTERPHCKDQVLRYGGPAPLWIRSDHQPPDDIPACPCGSPRTFEFQLMPQLLHHLTNHCTSKDNNNNTNNKSDPEYERIKAALQQADSIVQQAPPEHVPPELVERQAKCAAEMRRRLLGQHPGRQQQRLDWGVVAVYTCADSCCRGGASRCVKTDDTGIGNERLASSYVEEFCWRQPAIDDETV